MNILNQVYLTSFDRDSTLCVSSYLTCLMYNNNRASSIHGAHIILILEYIEDKLIWHWERSHGHMHSIWVLQCPVLHPYIFTLNYVMSCYSRYMQSICILILPSV